MDNTPTRKELLNLLDGFNVSNAVLAALGVCAAELPQDKLEAALKAAAKAEARRGKTITERRKALPTINWKKETER
jgi:UDP-N-acetylmuramyl pentapeptide synthase